MTDDAYARFSNTLTKLHDIFARPFGKKNRQGIKNFYTRRKLILLTVFVSKSSFDVILSAN